MVAASVRKIMEAAKTPKMKRDWEYELLAVNTGMFHLPAKLPEDVKK